VQCQAFQCGKQKRHTLHWGATHALGGRPTGVAVLPWCTPARVCRQQAHHMLTIWSSNVCCAGTWAVPAQENSVFACSGALVEPFLVLRSIWHRNKAIFASHTGSNPVSPMRSALVSEQYLHHSIGCKGSLDQTCCGV
jgi:hypothetical protein